MDYQTPESAANSASNGTTIETPSSSSGHSSRGHGNVTVLPVRKVAMRADPPPTPPQVLIDPSTSVIQLVRPGDPGPSPVLRDISMHFIPADVAEEQLATFRRAFLPMFPFVHIPETTSSAELRQTRPFLWLTAMCLTTKSVAQQFAIEETIWNIISQRIVAQYMAEMDLLLGLICFASWSHYFKRDKPFMHMLAQLAVSLAIDLGLHKPPLPSNFLQQSKSWRLGGLPSVSATPRARTVEERRTMLAVYHLTTAAWVAHRRTQPYTWTPWLDDCLRVLTDEKEAYLDLVLVAQVKCNHILNQLDVLTRSEPSLSGGGAGGGGDDDQESGNDGAKYVTAAMATALTRQLTDVKKSLPAKVLEDRYADFYLTYTELSLRSTVLRRPRPAYEDPSLPSIPRLQDLEVHPPLRARLGRDRGVGALQRL
jgi:hypothetical protein